MSISRPLEAVPCHLISRDVWPIAVPLMEERLKESHFIAVDLELSGIGDRKCIHSRDLNERFLAIKAATKKCALLEIGLSLIKMCPSSTKVNHSTTNDSPDNNQEVIQVPFEVETYSIPVKCQSDYILEDQAKIFLENHGFDFESHESAAIGYRRAGDSSPNESSNETTTTTTTIAQENDQVPSLQSLWHSILQSQLPLVFHNGLRDLMFLYEHLIAHLPDGMDKFKADLQFLFPAGIFDTKLIAEMDEQRHSSPTHLSYLFYECQRSNLHLAASDLPHLLLTWPEGVEYYEKLAHKTASNHPVLSREVTVVENGNGLPELSVSVNVDLVQTESGDAPTSAPQDPDSDSPIEVDVCNMKTRIRVFSDTTDLGTLPKVCENFKTYGWCQGQFKSGKLRCDMSHDVDEILNVRHYRRIKDLKANLVVTKKKSGSKKKGRKLKPSPAMTMAMIDVKMMEDTMQMMLVLNGQPLEKPNKNKFKLGLERPHHQAGYDAFMTAYIMCYFLIVKTYQEEFPHHFPSEPFLPPEINGNNDETMKKSEKVHKNNPLRVLQQFKYKLYFHGAEPISPALSHFNCKPSKAVLSWLSSSLRTTSPRTSTSTITTAETGGDENEKSAS